MSTSSNTMILPTASTSIGVARAQINDSFLALLQNFYSGSRPASTNITYEGAGFSPPNGTLWVNSTTGALYKADSVFGKNATLAPFSRYGIGYRIEPSLNSANTNQSSYEVGELVSVTATGIAQADARLYMKFSNNSPHFVDVGVPPTGSITSTMLADGSITAAKLASGVVGNGLETVAGAIQVKPNTSSGSVVDVTASGVRVGYVDADSSQIVLRARNNSTGNSAGSRVLAQTGLADVTAQLAVFNGGGSPYAEIRTGSAVSRLFISADLMRFQNAANTTEFMRLDSNGQLGIGTTSPDALLTVNGRASFGPGAAGTPSIAALGDLNTGFWFPGGNILAASTAGSERMRVVANGNIGIGTTSPSFPLTVAGTIQSTTGGFRFPDATTQTTAGVTAASNVGTGSGVFKDRSGDALRFRSIKVARSVTNTGSTNNKVLDADISITTNADDITITLSITKGDDITGGSPPGS